MNRPACLLLLCLCPVTVHAQATDLPPGGDDPLGRLDGSLQAIARLLERQVAQTDAVLAMQQVSLQTTLSLRLTDQVSALEQALAVSEARVSSTEAEIEDLETRIDEVERGLSQEDMSWERKHLERLTARLPEARETVAEARLKLSERQTDHRRCLETLQDWQARVDGYLGRWAP
jgi:chromosome segregation ATPase